MSRTGNKLLAGYLFENASHSHLLFKTRLLPAGPASSSLPFPFAMKALEIRKDLPLEDWCPTGVT